MRVLIPGIDGYLGWPLAQHLAARGHEVCGIDNLARRAWVEEMGSHSAIPVSPFEERVRALAEARGKEILFFEGDLTDYATVERAFADFQPEAIVHLGECPSAPYSMIDVDHTVFVQMNNIASTLNILYAMRDICPEAHLVKLGTMGEYGTPNIDIPEGSFEIDYRGRVDRLPFPRQAGSWYHWSKVSGSQSISFACKIWGIGATDVMQGVVFGTRIDEMGRDERNATRLDFDQCFGTSVNRFCCQAVIEHPLTPYGKGHQKRGFIPLRDSIQCLRLALEAPPEPGEYRVLNQFQEVYEVSELAYKVQRVASMMGMDVEVHNLENPRNEAEEHYYSPDHQKLFDLGYVPSQDIDGEIAMMLEDLSARRARIEAKRSVLIPDVRWSDPRGHVSFF